MANMMRRCSSYLRQQSRYGKISLSLNALSLGLLVFCFLLLAVNASRGFDITDRSFALLWAGQPHNVTGGISHFGFVTGIIYRLVGESITAFKVVGLLILLSAGFVFAHALKRYWDDRFSAIGPVPLLSIALIGLVGVLFRYGSWLSVPDYNWLALVATLITISGLLYSAVSARKTPLFVTSIAMVASGGVLAFIARPTTALILVFVTLLWVSLERPNRWGLLFAVSSATLAALVLLVFVRASFGSLSSYTEYLRFGLESGAALEGGHTIGETVTRSWDQIVDFLEWWIKRPFVHFFIGLALLLSFLGTLQRALRPYAHHALLSAALVLLVYLMFGDLHVSAVLLSVLGCLLLVFLRSILMERTSNLGVDVKRTQLSRGLLLVFFFVLAALAVAFGTANPIIRQMTVASVFLAASIFVMLSLLTASKDRRVFVSTYGLVLAVLVTMTMISAYNQPYRLIDDIGKQTVAVSFLNPNHRLRVDQTTAAYVEGLKKAAVDGGWEAGTPLIDMTGGSPGALVILDARIVGVPWLLGGYKGSDMRASRVLQSVDRAILDEAWILTAPEGRRRLDEQVLIENDLSFPDDYIVVGSVTTAHRNEEQFLWKPKNDK